MAQGLTLDIINRDLQALEYLWEKIMSYETTEGEHLIIRNTLGRLARRVLKPKGRGAA